MVTERENLLASCLAEPADDTARLVYADYLREQDTPGTAAIGWFVWGGVTLSQFRGNAPVEDGMFFDAQKAVNDHAPGVMGSQLQALVGWDWNHVLWDQAADAPDRLTCVEVPPKSSGGYRAHASSRARMAANRNRSGAVYERGMLHSLGLPLAAWRGVATSVLTACPLERVVLRDLPGLTLSVKGPVEGWRLTGELVLPPRPPRTTTTTVLSTTWPDDSEYARGYVPLDRSTLGAVVEQATDWILYKLQLDSGEWWPFPSVEGSTP